MSISPSYDSADESAEQPLETVAPTGNGAVDVVLESLAGLAERPVAEHVAVFEQAHEQLRSALDAPAGPKPPAVPAPPVG
ncbi:hypothetical protein [Nocardioides cavernaquae]|uniref:Uncharacterized protein n=1 Tax=Nocardioides cavernaquae TaxID=2321396 RepID=A0A3A5HAB6_9ACTN|nr:hypothetical protein [Nocardioides cavernaquae]RJS47302.1 hypothetical protein D4739_14450 [Nocardioides cavernaquae]